MPEVICQIRWPDGTEDRCYSPSTIIRDYLAANASYSVTDFTTRVTTALDHAALRVKAVHGMRCTRADAEARRLSQIAKKFRPEEIIACLSMT